MKIVLSQAIMLFGDGTETGLQHFWVCFMPLFVKLE